MIIYGRKALIVALSLHRGWVVINLYPVGIEREIILTIQELKLPLEMQSRDNDTEICEYLNWAVGQRKSSNYLY